MSARLSMVVLRDDGTCAVNGDRLPFAENDESVLIATPDADRLLADLDRVTTRMMVYGSRGERDAAQRLRDAAGLGVHDS